MPDSRSEHRLPRAICARCQKDLAVVIPEGGTDYVFRTHRDRKGKPCEGSRAQVRGAISG